MKKFIKGRWFPLIVAISILVLVAGVVLVMALLGWRFTYAPELENSWDAVSAFASWVGVIMSFLAVMAAVWIPKRIADQQDKIALFEKRVACFAMLETQRQIYFSIKDETDIQKIKHGVALVYSTDPLCDFNRINFFVLVDKFSNQCTQMSFLFDGIKYKEASELGIAFGKFIAALYNTDNERVTAAKTAYLKKIDDFVNKHIEEMSRCLFISK